ncbi:MAG: c-type cytochrome [Bacteroidetes bacterium]|nr:c-type cytochrome [Bacteroidota bacterium]
MNKRIFKISRNIVLVVIIIISCGAAYIKFALPSIPLEEIHVAITADRVERGKYLFNHVAACVSCHSEREENKFTMPVKPGTEGAGGEEFNRQRGFPGSYTAANITPYGLGQWTDAEIFRAITSGVSKDGHALFPIMPYLHYGTVDKEDIFSIIAYVRTLKSIKKDRQPDEYDFPMNLIINTIPQKPHFQTRPDTGDSVAYGRYLVTMAGCIHCHSQEEKGKLIAGMEFGGGRPFLLPTGGTLHSANITPDMESGIGQWTSDMFIQRFRVYADSSFQSKEVAKNTFNSIMPWTDFAKMKTEDLAAIYAYLRTIKPVKNTVVRFSVNKNN